MDLTAELPDGHVRARVEDAAADEPHGVADDREPGGPSGFGAGVVPGARRRHILMYSQPGKAKLSNIDANPNVASGARRHRHRPRHHPHRGHGRPSTGHPPADQVPEYAAKYAERIGAIFGTVERFAAAFSEAIVITPRRLHA